MSFEFPFEYADIEGIGKLFYPIVRVELRTTEGWRPFEFLVDTGADVTTVPTHLLPLLGLKKRELRSGETLGVGGIVVKTWEFSLAIKIGNRELTVAASAVETQNDSLPLLLGRKDVFENAFNLLLDSKKKMTILSEN